MKKEDKKYTSLSNLVYILTEKMHTYTFKKKRRRIIRADLCMQQNRRPESTSGVLVHPPTPPPGMPGLVLFNPGMI
jgi:hypothetical protein